MKPIFQQRVLVVEDDQRMLELLCKGLREVGHIAVPASDGEVGLELAMNQEFNAIVLDLGLPLRDGIELVLTLRRQNRGTPVLVVTARDAEDDVIRGLESGADHYLVKPFSFPELLARLNGLARSPCRNRAASQLVLNPLRLAAIRDGKVILLTRNEYLLLAALRDYACQPVSRQILTKAVWGNVSIDSNTLDVLVNSLRSKFDGPYARKRILTVRGVGYLLQSETEPDFVPPHSAELTR